MHSTLVLQELVVFRTILEEKIGNLVFECHVRLSIVCGIQLM